LMSAECLSERRHQSERSASSVQMVILGASIVSSVMPEESHDGPLAEFVALRAELLQRAANQAHLMSLQLTAVGAILSLAIARGSLRGLALVIPLVGYSLYSRYVDDALTVIRIARYIRDDLDSRVPGGLRWERWLAQDAGRSSLHSRISRFMLFPAISAVSLAWTFGFVFAERRRDLVVRIVLAVIWAAGLAGAIHHGIEIVRGRFHVLWRTPHTKPPPHPGSNDGKDHQSSDGKQTE
jgi:hypothetical protein